MDRSLAVTAAVVGAMAAVLVAATSSAAAAEDTGHGVITLADVVALTLERSPELASFSWDIRAAEAREVQARLRPNPELNLAIEDVRLGSGPGTTARQTAVGWSGDGPSVQLERARESGAASGFSEAEFTLSLWQLIELGGKRARRMELAARDREVAAWDYEVARADVLLSAVQAFAAVLAAQQHVALDQELVQLAEQEFSTVAARVKAGRVSPLEEARAQTTVSLARIEANSSAQRLEEAKSALAASWGDAEARFERAAGDLGEVREMPPLDELKSRVEGSPDLARWRAELDKREAAVLLAKSNGLPDVTVTAGFRALGTPDRNERAFGVGSDGFLFADGRSRSDSRWENSAVLGVSVPLPLFNRNQGLIVEAEQLTSKGTDERRAAEVKAHVRLARAYQQTANAYDTALSLKNDVIPAVEQTLKSVTTGYEQGKFGYLDVVDAQRNLFQAREQHLEALTAYHQNLAEIERSLGAPVWEEVN